MLLIHRLPLAVDAFRRAPGQCKKRVFNRPASCRSRKLGTAFRSPVTTLSPPLRGQCSRPAPSFPRRVILCEPVRPKAPPLGSVSKPKPGEFFTLDPLSAPISSALVMSPISTPLQVVSNPPDQSVQPASSQETRLARRPIVFCSPLRALSISPRITARNPSSSCSANRSVNPGTETIMNPKRRFVK